MTFKQKIKNVLISVYDKTNIVKFARILIKNNMKLFSTGGTAKKLKNSGIAVTEISDITNFPEIMDNRIKTLHPKIFAGILRRPYIDNDILKKWNIISFDMVIVNFYPFEKMLESNKYHLNEMLEYIDIGGPSIIRAAVKNYTNVIIITNIIDYFSLIKYISRKPMSISQKFDFAIKALAYVTNYDNCILSYLKMHNKKEIIQDNNFPKLINLSYHKKQHLSYGENKHQKAVFYIKKTKIQGTISSYTQVQGKTLSFNNILDADTALECVKEFTKPTCVIVKHGNPCGVSSKSSILEAYRSAYATDPNSAFGGVIAFNFPLDPKTANTIVKNQFVEVIITPPYNYLTKAIMEKKPKVRILFIPNLFHNLNECSFKHVQGGLLLQNANQKCFTTKNWKIVTVRKPNNLEIQDAIFCWKVAKHVKSNAIVYSKNNQTIAIGAGQMSRIDATCVANMKSAQQNKNTKKATLASDAFLPFKDNVEEAAKIGISCIIQPGGSIRDKEVIISSNKNNISMIFTNIRHFKH